MSINTLLTQTNNSHLTLLHTHLLSLIFPSPLSLQIQSHLTTRANRLLLSIWSIWPYLSPSICTDYGSADPVITTFELWTRSAPVRSFCSVWDSPIFHLSSRLPCLSFLFLVRQSSCSLSVALPQLAFLLGDIRYPSSPSTLRPLISGTFRLFRLFCLRGAVVCLARLLAVPDRHFDPCTLATSLVTHRAAHPSRLTLSHPRTHSRSSL